MNSWVKNNIKCCAILMSLALITPATSAQSLEQNNAIRDPGLNAGAYQQRDQNEFKVKNEEKRYIDTIPKESVNKDSILDAKKDIRIGDYIYNPQFHLEKINFNGNSLYSDEKLNKLAKSLLGKTVYMEDIIKLTVEISRFYQKNGYLTCHAYIPPQEVTNGVIQINVTESKVDKISIKGNKWAKTSYLKNNILGSNVKSGKVFNAKKLQGSLREINNQDYISSQVQINKTQSDTTEIILEVEDRMPVSFDVVWDNYGRDLTGRQRANLIAGYDNVTGHGDKIYGGAILATGTQGALAGYEIPVGPHGTKIGFDYTFSNVELGKQYKNLNIRGYAHDYIFKVTHPLIRTADTEVLLKGSFDALNTKTKNNTTSPISDYKLRVFRAALQGMHDDINGRWIADIGTDFGASILGASKSDINGQEGTFFKTSAGVTRVQRLPRRSLGILKLNGQYSPNVLYSAEQMQLGGPYSLRGFEPGVMLGEWGLSGTAEIRTPIPHLDALLPKKVEHWEDKVKFTTFYDWGYVAENLNDQGQKAYGYNRKFLHSIGCGFFINLTERISAAFNVGMPVGGRNYDSTIYSQPKDVRFNFAITSEVDKMFFKPQEKL